MKMRFILYVILFMIASTTVYAQKTYKVGDIYDENGKEGVVFIVTDNGMHGKIYSIRHIYADFYTGKEWCKSLGEGWHLPTLYEIESLHYMEDEDRSNIDSIITPIATPIARDVFYWIDLESRHGQMLFDMDDGTYFPVAIYQECCVRAIADF